VKPRPQAIKEHLMVGIALILLLLGIFLASLMLDTKTLPFLNFFFGVWGGVETGNKRGNVVIKIS
jgi:uncharacterized membrane protein YiaA